MSRSSYQKGFSAVEGLLILVIVCMIGFVGWYVWHSKQAADESAANTGNSSTPTPTKNDSKETNDLTANWKTFSADNDTYSLRLADGWKFSFYRPTTLSGAPSADLAGKTAVVTTVEGGKDGFVGFLAAYDETTTKRSFSGYTEDGVAYSNDLEGKKYTRTSTESIGMAPTEGTVTHAYYFVKGGHGYYFSYSFTPDETNLTTTAEQMIATATFK